MKEDTGRLSDSGPHRTPGSGAKPAGRQPHRPSRSRPSLPGGGSKRPGLASQRSDPISALPAGLLGPPAPSRDARFTSPAMGDLAINAQLGNRDAVQTPPLAPLKSFFRRCQFAVDFDPIFSRLGGGDKTGAPMESYRRGRAQGRGLPLRPQTSAPKLSRLTLG